MTTALAIALAASTGRQALTLLYSAKFLGAYVPLAILMVASMGRVVRTSCTEVLMAQGRRATSNAILVATVVLELALLWVLAARYGIAGAAVAAAASALVAGAWAALSLRDTLGARPILVTLVRCLLAAAVVGAALAWAKPAPAWLLVAYPVAVVAYGEFCGCCARSIETISLRCSARCADRLYMATEQHIYALSEMAASGQAVPDASDRKRTLWALASLTVIGAVLRLSTITSRGLWQDEAAQIGQMTGTVLDTIKSQIGGTHPPLFHVLMHFWIQAFGTSEAALRSFSVLVGVASIPLAYWAGTTLYNRTCRASGRGHHSHSRRTTSGTRRKPACTRS